MDHRTDQSTEYESLLARLTDLVGKIILIDYMTTISTNGITGSRSHRANQ